MINTILKSSMNKYLASEIADLQWIMSAVRSKADVTKLVS
jgi:hypothetical protein